jgi:pimeloyl-ACP methyl ester carboxylesterase
MLGWSDGGITAMIAAAKYPQWVDKLVIWGANSYIVEEEAKIYESEFYLLRTFCLKVKNLGIVYCLCV